MNRRHFLRSAAALGGVLFGDGLPELALPERLASRESAPSDQPLRNIAASRGVLFGAAIRERHLVSDAAYANVVAQQCGILTPELELKWEALRPSPDTYDFSGADWLHNFAVSHGMKFRGHTLVWDAALPAWFATAVKPENAEKILVDHISTIVRHYAGQMHSWDVVNEAIEPADQRPDGMKQTPWLRFMGPDYIETAFHAAHEADPSATLVYNENWLEPETAAGERKRQVTLAMLTQFKKKGVPVHGLGIQSHVFGEAYVTGPQFRQFLQEVSDLGLAILISEMDVRDKNLPADVGVRDQMVAAQYYKYVSFLLGLKSVKTVETWGLCNRYTWIAQSQSRTDGLPVRPLLYDAAMQPTPAWFGLHRAFAEAATR